MEGASLLGKPLLRGPTQCAPSLFLTLDPRTDTGGIADCHETGTKENPSHQPVPIFVDSLTLGKLANT